MLLSTSIEIFSKNRFALFCRHFSQQFQKMNGCELPCGTSIRVEPASTSYSESQHYGPTDSSPSKAPIAVKPSQDGNMDMDGGKDGDDGEDLDDFFASL